MAANVEWLAREVWACGAPDEVLEELANIATAAMLKNPGGDEGDLLLSVAEHCRAAAFDLYALEK